MLWGKICNFMKSEIYQKSFLLFELFFLVLDFLSLTAPNTHSYTLDVSLWHLVFKWMWWPTLNHVSLSLKAQIVPELWVLVCVFVQGHRCMGSFHNTTFKTHLLMLSGTEFKTNLTTKTERQRRKKNVWESERCEETSPRWREGFCFPCLKLQYLRETLEDTFRVKMLKVLL